MGQYICLCIYTFIRLAVRNLRYKRQLYIHAVDVLLAMFEPLLNHCWENTNEDL